jgi:tellurite resistance protein
MGLLLLTEELAHALLGALLAVCRADGDANQDEMRALRRVGDELTGGARFDNEWLLFFSNVTPSSLAEAVGGSHGGPFRAQGVSAPSLIVQEFVRAAIRVGRADGAINEAEARLILDFGEALGVPVGQLAMLDASLGNAW